jgi:hypothetical protein
MVRCCRSNRLETLADSDGEHTASTGIECLVPLVIAFPKIWQRLVLSDKGEHALIDGLLGERHMLNVGATVGQANARERNVDDRAELRIRLDSKDCQNCTRLV